MNKYKVFVLSKSKLRYRKNINGRAGGKMQQLFNIVDCFSFSMPVTRGVLSIVQASLHSKGIAL